MYLFSVIADNKGILYECAIVSSFLFGAHRIAARPVILGDDHGGAEHDLRQAVCPGSSSGPAQSAENGSPDFR